MQRHHLLPRQLLREHAFGKLFELIGCERIGFDDFRTNGLLLPANEAAALKVRMPLHRGPHRDYNQLVAGRVGQIEAGWSRLRLRAPEIALDQALMRLDLLQRALRRRLLAGDKRQMRLNRHDPLGQGIDFAELDAMADALWASTDLQLQVGEAGEAHSPLAPSPLEISPSPPVFSEWRAEPRDELRPLSRLSGPFMTEKLLPTRHLRAECDASFGSRRHH